MPNPDLPADDSSEADLSQPVVAVHDLLLDPARHEAYRDGEPLGLSRTEFRLFCVLANRPGCVLARRRILAALYGDRHAVSDRAVDVQIVGLRKKLGPSAGCIETVQKQGYRLKE